MYNDMNPVRGKIVKHPREYKKWSSFFHYAYGQEDKLITEPECYLELGETAEERQREYRRMVDYVIKYDWKKKNYSNTAFIGDPQWVKMRYLKLKLTKKKRSLEKQKKKIKIKDPPGS